MKKILTTLALLTGVFAVGCAGPIEELPAPQGMIYPNMDENALPLSVMVTGDIGPLSNIYDVNDDPSVFKHQDGAKDVYVLANHDRGEYMVQITLENGWDDPAFVPGFQETYKLGAGPADVKLVGCSNTQRGGIWDFDLYADEVTLTVLPGGVFEYHARWNDDPSEVFGDFRVGVPSPELPIQVYEQ